MADHDAVLHFVVPPTTSGGGEGEQYHHHHHYHPHQQQPQETPPPAAWLPSFAAPPSSSSSTFSPYGSSTQHADPHLLQHADPHRREDHHRQQPPCKQGGKGLAVPCRAIEELREYVHSQPPRRSSSTSSSPHKEGSDQEQQLDYFGFPAALATIHFDEVNHRVWYPHENYIPVNFHLLTRTLLDLASDCEGRIDEHVKESFAEFAGVYLYVVQANHEALTRELQLYQTLFNPALDTNDLQAETSETSQRQRMMNSFIHNFVRTMRKANFNPLTQDQIKFAANPEQVLFGVPMRIDWEKLDSNLLQSYFNSIDEPDVPPPPPFARNCLVFWRGVGVHKRTGLFLLAKLDNIVQKFLNVAKFALGPILPTSHVRTSEGLASVAQDYTGDESQSPSTSIHLPRSIERKTLLTSSASFFEKVTIEEPTYKEVVLLFKKKKSSKEATTPDDNAIFIQRFYDIPMKNLQVVFPVQRAGWNWADILSFLMLLSFSITLAFKAFFTLAHSTYIDEAVLGLLFLLFPLFLRWVNRKIGAHQSHRQARNMAARSLKNNSLNCNKSVLSYIHEASIEQEFKEALLAYFVIWQWGDGIRKNELDAAIEHFIESRFGVEVDFEVDDALNKLMASSLVFTKRSREGDELYHAIPPHEAIKLAQDELVTAARRHFT